MDKLDAIYNDLNDFLKEGNFDDVRNKIEEWSELILKIIDSNKQVANPHIENADNYSNSSFDYNKNKDDSFTNYNDLKKDEKIDEKIDDNNEKKDEKEEKEYFLNNSCSKKEKKNEITNDMCSSCCSCCNKCCTCYCNYMYKSRKWVRNRNCIKDCMKTLPFDINCFINALTNLLLYCASNTIEWYWKAIMYIAFAFLIFAFSSVLTYSVLNIAQYPQIAFVLSLDWGLNALCFYISNAFIKNQWLCATACSLLYSFFNPLAKLIIRHLNCARKINNFLKQFDDD